MKSKLEIIIREFNESCPEGHLPKMPNVDVFKFSEMKERIMEQLESYTGTPFTIQRLCELLVQPKRHYKRTDKFMRGSWSSWKATQELHSPFKGCASFLS